MSKTRAQPAAEGAGETDDYVLEDQVGHLLRKAHQRATAIFQTTIGDPSITPMQYAALVRLYQMGEQPQTQLGRRTAMDPATILGVIRRLNERALTATRPDPSDGRRTLVGLTSAGRALAGTLIENGPIVSSETLKPLAPQEQALFLRFLARLT
ncbi:MAG: MarR family winged helix-turn-helix transcriptional regulator [Alphaproteobacteria bacterium]